MLQVQKSSTRLLEIQVLLTNYKLNYEIVTDYIDGVVQNPFKSFQSFFEKKMFYSEPPCFTGFVGIFFINKKMNEALQRTCFQRQLPINPSKNKL